MPIRFRFRWIPFVATLVAVALGVSLGQWQIGRAAEKRAIEAKLTAREAAAPVTLQSGMANADDLEYRKVIVRGEFVGGWPVWLDNRPYNGAAGFYLMMPLKIAGSDMHILVARGWAPRNAADRTRLPNVPTPQGMIEVQGVARRNPGHVLQLGNAAPPNPGAIVQNIDIAAFTQASGLKMQPVLLEQTSDMHDGLVRDWPRPSSGVEKHLGYAFQWYALAATAFIFFVVTGFRRGTK